MYLSGSLKLRDSLKSALYYIRYGLFEYDMYNPVRGMNMVAYEETMDYVKEHMRQAMACVKPSQLITHGLQQVEAKGGYWEFGVFKGGTINHIAKSLPSQEIHGFDSFEGLPENWYSGDVAKGKFTLGGRLPSVRSNVTLHKGWFDKSIPQWKKNYKEKAAFIHIDCDLYSAAKTVFDELGNRIQKGTVIVFDEYFNYPNWQNGEFKAFQEFVRVYNVKYTYLGYSRMQVAVKIEEIKKK